MNRREQRTSTAPDAREDEPPRRVAEQQPSDEQPAGSTPRSTAAMAAAMEQRPTDTTANAPTAQDQRRPTADMDSTATGPLFAADEAERFRSHWTEIQTGFVDEPRRSVERADGLVADVIQRLAQVFARERDTLEQQWGKGDDVSTEDLRLALRRYRSFFERLLAA
ncbi:MAG: hypothetical protein ACRDJE_20125 [Dehalococcoidia bacterium]